MVTTTIIVVAIVTMDKRRIIITAMIGAIAVSTLSVSLTLAWYASSNRLKVNSFDIDMNGNVQLLMSTSKELNSFKEKLTKEDLVEEEFYFAPVSSMYQDTWYDQKADMPLFYDSSTPALDGVVREEIATSGFFQKKIYLMSNAVSYYATLDVKNCAFNYVEAFNSIRAQTLHEEFTDMSVSEITEKLNSLRDCLRMSILINTEDCYRYYIIDPYKNENEQILFGGRLDNDADGYYDFYTDANDGKKKEVIYGEISGTPAYKDAVDPNGEVETLKGKNLYFGNSFEAKSRVDTCAFDLENSNELTIATEQSYSLDDLSGNDTDLLIPCYQGVPTEIVVSIYLEGWDKACINQTMGACFDTNISFKLLRRI